MSRGKRFELISFVLVTCCATQALAKPIAFSEVRIPTRQKAVRLDVYQPSDPPSVRAGQAESYGAASQKLHPTILLLYGAGGLAFDGSRMRVTAERLVQAGYNVYLLHYFDETGAFMTTRSSIPKHFNEWVETVRYAIDWIYKQPFSSGPIGVWGYSLGGFIALEAASDNPQVGALVDHAGGWVESDMKALGRMPPLLFLNGQRDRWVPYKKYVQPMFSYLEQQHIPYESHVYPTQGHKFKPAALEEVRTLAIEFFRQHLSSKES
jgi:dienelactone hydrolase